MTSENRTDGMEPRQRIVTRTPLPELWNDTGTIPSSRIRELSTDQIQELLRLGRVQFVVANVGSPLVWVPIRDCFAFWKNEARAHVTDHRRHIRLESFPGEYC